MGIENESLTSSAIKKESEVGRNYGSVRNIEIFPQQLFVNALIYNLAPLHKLGALRLHPKNIGIPIFTLWQSAEMPDV